jgi:putative tricarboxylic transport membrane protein
MFELFPTVVYSLFIILLVGNVLLFGIGRIFAFVYAKLGQLPTQLLVPIVMLMAVVGAYSYNNNAYDVMIMLFFGVLGYFMRLTKIPEAPLVITFLLGPQVEENLRRALLINEGHWAPTLFGSWLAIGLAVAVVVFTYLSARVHISERMREISEGTGDEPAKL